MKRRRFLSRTLSALFVGATALTLASCGGDNSSKKDSIVLMSDDVSGLYNPFYATSGADQEVTGMTQIGMLTTDRNGQTACGDDLPTVVKAYKQELVDSDTVYTFVLKNNLKFSDGVALTMNDVLFNMYEYLDPVYTGSSTMYSIKIKGLTQYRTQKDYSGSSSQAEDAITSQASALAQSRIEELIYVFEENGLVEGTQNSYSLNEAGMRAAINNWDVNEGYKSAVATEEEQKTLTMADYRKKLAEDYDLTLSTFKDELKSDYLAAKESYDLTTDPYKAWAKELESDIFKFFLFEGYITPVYKEVQGKKDKTVIEKFENTSIAEKYKTEDEAINRVYSDYVKTQLNTILSYWGTAGTLTTKYTGAARDVIIHNNVSGDDGLTYKNISGIVSLGHTTDVQSVEIEGTKYNVCHDHNTDGSVKDASTYDVLQITLDGQDPKAIYNFGFTVAPAHYYTADATHPNGREIDIVNNKFGVEYASSDFQSKVIQSQQHVEVPVGAGAYQATDENNNDNPSGDNFVRSNVIYYKANPNFMFEVKTAKLRLQIISSANAIDKLAAGEVDFVTPQFTKANSERLNSLSGQGIKKLDTWQLGYGYIGINAGKVPNVNVRRAIMAAMQTSLALEYYEAGTCKNIDWPMSTVSWAYPFEDDGKTSKSNGHDYTQWTGVAQAKNKIKNYMNAAGVSQGDASLKIKFTIAGASITEHPTYTVFKQAAEILNELGWNVEVKADSQALTKLATGSLEVWAAAWGSTIDPDMYQVYHKNSSATSVYAWGYREILNNQTKYSYEYKTISDLSVIIDDAREITDQAQRKTLYEEAMGYVLDLAVEMPVYQRKTLYAYNSKTITGLTDDVNPYTSPLEQIWNIELVK